jgi:protein-disulfide isomerase
MSNKREREKRREEREAQEAKASSSDRRTRLLQLGAGAVFLAIVAVVVVIVVAGGSSSSGGDATKIEEVAQVESLVNGNQQQKLALGDPKAPVELIEYGDLQCPVCKEYSEEILPPIVEKQVKNGEAKIIFRNFTIIGPESIPAGQAAIAAGNQGKGWDFLELFYRNQGEERSGYVTEEFLEAVGKGAGVKDLAKFNQERKTGKTKKEVESTTEQAATLGFEGTPSFAIKGPGSNGLELLGTLETVGEFEEAIKQAS